MALTEIQWGRILALAWIDDQFRKSFEKDPAKALRDLNTHSGLGADLFEELGLDNNPPLVDLERIVDYPVDFAGIPKERLLKIQGGEEQDKVKMSDARWYWGLREGEIKSDVAIRSVDGTTLTAAEWGRIYACIWEDERFGGASKQDYKRRFERDPAEIVEKITEKLGILYKRGDTPLFVFAEKPSDWDDEQLEGIVTTGKVNGHPLVWMVTKCC
jgi:hypothetical protein